MSSANQKDRLSALMAMLQKQPDDAFTLYAVGMEYKKRNEPGKAIEYFDRALSADAGYCYAYYQRGQVQEQIGDAAGAKATYAKGIAAAQQAGDAHAASELQGALQMLG